MTQTDSQDIMSWEFFLYPFLYKYVDTKVDLEVEGKFCIPFEFCIKIMLKFNKKLDYCCFQKTSYLSNYVHLSYSLTIWVMYR